MPPPAEGFVTRLVVGPALRAQPDGRLVTLVREGYEAAFEEIVRRYRLPLRSCAAAIVGGSADDVTQDALSKAFLALRRDDREIELRPWLYRILRNTALNDLRDRPARTAELDDALEGGRGVAEEVERREEIGELLGRLRALPEPQRAAIVMRELEGLGHEEIAVALGISGGAARQAIHRARTALRDGLGMAIPLPLLRLMLEGSAAPAAEIAAGGAGAGLALKAATATVLVAGTIGAGVALHHETHNAVKSADHAATGGATKEAGRVAMAPGKAARATDQNAQGAKGGGSPGHAQGNGGGSSGPSDGVRGDGTPRSGSHDVSEGGSSDPRSGHGGGESGGGTTGDGQSGSGGPGSGDSASSEGLDSSSGSGEGSGDNQGSGEVAPSGDGSGSNSGPDSGGEEDTLGAETDGSRDSGGGEGLSGQMETRTTTEEDR